MIMFRNCAIMPVLVLSWLLVSQLAVAQEPYYVVPMSRVSDADRATIDSLIPEQAPAVPKKARRLLIYDVNGNYGGHSAIPFANYALQKMGEKTGAFETVLSHDKVVFEKESLARFDGIFFNNVVGSPFEDQKYFDNIVEFVKNGGGLMGVHGTTAAFLYWGKGPARDIFPEFGQIIGGRGANHRSQTEKLQLRIDDPANPITKAFPQEGFEWTDEFFRFPTVYSRDKLHVLISIDVEKSGLEHVKPYRQERADDDYGVAWIQKYGQGRSFYCSLAHNKNSFMDARLLTFYLAGTQYILGDLEANDLPSNSNSNKP